MSGGIDDNRARNTDPITSHLGAEESAFRITEAAQFALDSVKEHPDKTQMELAKLKGVPDRTIGRFMARLVRNNYLIITGRRYCGVTGYMAQTYRIVEGRPRLK